MRLLLLLTFTYCGGLHAQDSTIIIKAGTSFAESVPINEIYDYPQFVNGKVFFKTGDSTPAKLNYHRFLDEMQFIDFKNDTLNIANAGLIKFIRINTDVFYYDKGYVKFIREANDIKLAERKTLRVSDKTKIGGYGAQNPTSAIDNYGVLYDQKGMYKLTPMVDVTLTRKTEYYFGDKYNHFVLANKKNLLQQFSKENRALNAYFKENNISFNNREQLEKLLQFLASL